MAYTWSKTWKPLMSEMTTTKKVLGLSNGSTTENKRRHHPAPSTRAASSSSGSIACSPASRITMTKPRSFHAEAMMIDGIAHAGSVHQPGPAMPNQASTVLTTPEVGLSSQRHTRATTIQLVTTGRKYTPRSEEHTSELQSRENLVCRLL